MTEPRNRYWRRIVPVVNEPIPDGAEYGNNNAWMYATEGEEFSGDDCDYDWRVPVPVVPLSVAVDAAVLGCVRDDVGYCWALGISAPTIDKLRQLVTAKLIELAEQEGA